MKIQMSVDIAAPPEKIWPFLVEPEKKLKWATILEKFEYTSDQRSGVGTPFYFVLKGRRPVRVDFVCREWVDNARLVSEMTSSDFVKSYEQMFVLEPTQSGTRLIFAEEIQWPYGIIGKIMGFFMKRRVELRVGEMAGVLKNMVEA